MNRNPAACRGHADVVGVGGELGGHVECLPAAGVIADRGVHHGVCALTEPAAGVRACSTPAGAHLARGAGGGAGGGLSQLSIVGLAMNPYINASIIMQLMTGVIPSLQALSREGEYGRQRLNQYTRYLTVPMALLQGFGILSALSAEGVIIGGFGLGNPQSWVQMITLIAGAVLLFVGLVMLRKGRDRRRRRAA